MNTIIKTLKLFIQICCIPVVSIKLNGSQVFYKIFTSRHPKYLIIKRKTIGVALIPIIGTFEEYLKRVNGKNSAAYYARKADRNGYIFTEINPNDYLDDIYKINTSKEFRQGQPMAEPYTRKIENIELDQNYNYYGVLSPEKNLVAYAWVPKCNEVWIISNLLGHGDHLNEGIMYKLIISIVKHIYLLPEILRPKFLMYDTFYGASQGLRMFKTKLGFKPYRVRWKK